MNIERQKAKMNPEYFIELPFKSETEDHSSTNKENSNMAAFSKTSDVNILSLDPLVDIKPEAEVFFESNDFSEHSYKMNSVLNEDSPVVANWEKNVLNVEGHMPRMNPEHSLEYHLKSETEDALSLPSINQETSNMAAFSKTSNDNFLFLDPLMDIKVEPEVFCESNEGDEYSYEMNSVVNEKYPLTCKKEVKQDGRKGLSGEKLFISTDCEKAFYTKINLRSHVINPTREKPFFCKECGKAFSWKHHLTGHMRSHTGEKPFMCKECGKAFSRVSALKVHTTIHTGEKPFLCKECGKAFSLKYNLKSHMKIHTGEKPFMCKECGKAYSRNHELTVHMRIHTGEKPFMCKECGKAFSRKHDLTVHMRIHTGEKPFMCKECGKVHSRKYALTVHMRVHTGEKPFTCKECGKACSRKPDLKVHMRIHTREKPFICLECGEAFSSKIIRTRHMKIHIGKHFAGNILQDI